MSMKMQDEEDARRSNVGTTAGGDDDSAGLRASTESKRANNQTRLRQQRSGSSSSSSGSQRRKSGSTTALSSAYATASSERASGERALDASGDPDDSSDDLHSSSDGLRDDVLRNLARVKDATRRRKSQDKRSAKLSNKDSSGKRAAAAATDAPAQRVVPKGKFRYLKPEEIERGHLEYDFCLVVNRSVKAPSRVGQLLAACLCCCCLPHGSESNNNARTPGRSSSLRDSSHERLGFRRLCLVNSPLLRESEDEHRRIVDKLCSEGLQVDIIDGGHSPGEMHSAYLILLVRATDVLVQSYLKRFRYDLWLEHGAVADMALDIVGRSAEPTPAERVQIVDYILAQRAVVSTRDPWIHDLFPMHDRALTDKLMSSWVASWRVTSLADAKVLKQLRSNFGEKVAYYFAFYDFYNRSLLPLAALGILMQLLHGVVSTTTYMRVLPFWGVGVCVVWSFTCLKRWARANATLQFAWNRKLHVKQIAYANKFYYGEARVNALTGEREVVYSAWRRVPKFVCVGLFLLAQMAIMLVLVAIWVTIYEMLKATFPPGGLFSTQGGLILLEGIVFGLFVDVIQWNMVVTKMGALFTHWENYKTEEQYERALIRKLFLLDFLNYYTWFFSLAFIFAIPGVGDYVTNALNRAVAGDAMNCCFGPYVDPHGGCRTCPLGPPDAACIVCVGPFTFDRHHVDLSAMFVTPIVVTQLLNIALGVLAPKLVRMRRERAQAAADADAQRRVMAAGSMKILGALDYDDPHASQFGNKAHARYLEYSATEIEVLNHQARALLFDSEQESYDPYNDFHALTVQFGFTVMFSILWPLMPAACFAINVLKCRTDGYRLCRTLKRPIPRRANGIGAWKGVLTVYAYIAVVVNVLLICVSTGALEFFDAACVRDIADQLAQQNKTLDDFVLGPDFGCMHVTYRLLAILLLEHALVGAAYIVMTRVPGVPNWIDVVMTAREKQFKELLRAREHELFDSDVPSSSSSTSYSTSASGPMTGSARRRGATKPDVNDDNEREYGVRLGDSRIDIAALTAAASGAAGAGGRSISIDSVTPGGSDHDELSDLDVPSSDGFRAKAREQLARQWSASSD